MGGIPGAPGKNGCPPVPANPGPKGAPKGAPNGGTNPPNGPPKGPAKGPGAAPIKGAPGNRGGTT